MTREEKALMALGCAVVLLAVVSIFIIRWMPK
jgi:hypothetical protein